MIGLASVFGMRTGVSQSLWPSSIIDALSVYLKVSIYFIILNYYLIE